MKKSLMRIIACCFLFVATNAFSADKKIYHSDPETIFCMEKADARKFQRFMEQKDVAASAEMINSEACQIVEPSLELYLDEDDDGVVGVHRVGMTTTVYTFKHMLK